MTCTSLSLSSSHHAVHGVTTVAIHHDSALYLNMFFAALNESQILQTSYKTEWSLAYCFTSSVSREDIAVVSVYADNTQTAIVSKFPLNLQLCSCTCWYKRQIQYTILLSLEAVASREAGNEEDNKNHHQNENCQEYLDFDVIPPHLAP